MRKPFSGREPRAPRTSTRGHAGAVIAALVVCVAGVLVLVGRAAMSGPSDAKGAGGVGASHRGTGAIATVIDAARSYRQKGETGKAEAILVEAVAEHPDSQPLHIAYG